MEKRALMTAEYYDAADPDKLIGAVYVPASCACACATRIGLAILKALGGNCLTAVLLDGDGERVDELPVFRNR